VRPVDHFAASCESLTQSDDRWEGQPLNLEPWQRRFWREALEDWRSVVLIVARKNGKTSMLAAYALYELVYGEGRPEILLAAASDRQAGRLFDAAARFVRRHPRSFGEAAGARSRGADRPRGRARVDHPADVGSVEVVRVQPDVGDLRRARVLEYA
jgi:phage terminase large subunit-like protein